MCAFEAKRKQTHQTKTLTKPSHLKPVGKLQFDYSLPSIVTPTFGHDFSRIPLHTKARMTIQPTLAISTPGDVYEQEADRLADQVMRTPGPQMKRTCDGGGVSTGQNKQVGREQLQTKRLQPNHSVESAVPPVVHEALSSSGQPLDTATRAFMEPRFGHDFSRVRVHTDERAAESSRTLNALAFTVGNDVIFGAGQFAPGTAVGRRLLAHELTHIVQNQEKPLRTVQRKIMIGGKSYTPTKANPDTPEKEDYEKYDNALLDQMDSGDAIYSFANGEEFQHELGLRTNAIKAVLSVIEENNRSVAFGHNPYDEAPGEFSLPREFWARANRKEYHLKSGPNVTPAKAVESIFNNGQGQTWLDCNMMLVAIQYKALLDTYGEERFNQMFPGGKNLIIGQNKIDDPGTAQKEGYTSTKSGSHPFFDQETHSRIEVAEGEDPLPSLIVGDWVYFKNVAEYTKLVDDYNQAVEDSTLDPGLYDRYKHNTAWQGEHAVYLGERKINVVKDSVKTVKGFAGFGLEEPETYEGMIEMLSNQWKYQYKSLQLARNNDFKTEVTDVSDVPDSVVKGKPRISSIFRINTPKIEALGK